MLQWQFHVKVFAKLKMQVNFLGVPPKEKPASICFNVEEAFGGDAALSLTIKPYDDFTGISSSFN